MVIVSLSNSLVTLHRHNAWYVTLLQFNISHRLNLSTPSDYMNTLLNFCQVNRNKFEVQEILEGPKYDETWIAIIFSKTLFWVLSFNSESPWTQLTIFRWAEELGKTNGARKKKLRRRFWSGMAGPREESRQQLPRLNPFPDMPHDLSTSYLKINVPLKWHLNNASMPRQEEILYIHEQSELGTSLNQRWPLSRAFLFFSMYSSFSSFHFLLRQLFLFLLSFLTLPNASSSFLHWCLRTPTSLVTPPLFTEASLSLSPRPKMNERMKQRLSPPLALRRCYRPPRWLIIN